MKKIDKEIRKVEQLIREDDDDVPWKRNAHRREVKRR